MATRKACTLKWYGDEVRKNIGADVDAKLRIACEWTLNEARKLMAEPKSGAARRHRRLKSGRVSKRQWSRGGQAVQRSAPGEAPASQTERLAGALAVGGQTKAGSVVLRKVKSNWWRVGTNVGYHHILEKGTDDGRLLPRPLMKPALARAWPQIKRLFKAR